MRKIVLCLVLWSRAILALARCDSSTPHDYELVMRTDWQDGIPAWAGVQAPTTAQISVKQSAVAGGAVLHVEVNRSDDFAAVANGSPRAELSLGRTLLANGTDYLLMWSTLLPADFMIDRKQPEIVTQIHQGPASGPPPFALLVYGDHYELNVRTDQKTSLRVIRFGLIADDLGRQTCWQLHYIPGAAGQHSVTELYRNGQPVLREHDLGNAYADDTAAYLKVGIYKWLWLTSPSDVSHREMDFGDVFLYQRRGGLLALGAGTSR
ncbi:heparin lyase I family protein [Paraburkholderia sp. BCC1885]|uniref:heparin lyase I family protein n=1 Tax=Paraburkholderia sp. BCC1885 TaxID=2562669 RepID=UPI001642540A|nr:heparin lyase I family protein [Paraburkholderia sp. BCC1885]